ERQAAIKNQLPGFRRQICKPDSDGAKLNRALIAIPNQHHLTQHQITFQFSAHDTEMDAFPAGCLQSRCHITFVNEQAAIGLWNAYTLDPPALWDRIT